MTQLTSQLVIELLDRVTSPARRAANALAGISNTVRETNGQPITFGDRLNAAITRNNRALADARGGLVDAVASFYALRSAIGAPIQAASDFESAMADVAKVVDFPSPEAFAQFQQDLFALSRDIPIAVTGLADIAAAAGQAGIAGQDLIRFTDAAARIGVAFDISAEQAGGSMANLMTALGLTIDETVSLADAMNHLSNSQASSAADILDVVQRVGAQATMFGFTAEETAAFASAMLAAGAQSEVAATSFRNMGAALTRGSAATATQRSALRELGLDAEDTARSMQENAVETTIDVLRRIGQLPAEQRAAISSQLFGNEARALGPLLTNLGLVEDTLGMVGDRATYAGSAFAEFAVRNNTFQANMQRFQNVLTELQINIGNALMPAITQLAEAVTPLITRLADLANAYPEVTLAVVGATAAVIAFKGAMAALRFAGLLGRGGVLSLIAAGYNSIGRAAIGARTAASSMIGLQSALAAMSGQPLGTLGRLRAGLTGIALAVPGVGALSSGIAAIGAAVATISTPVWGTFAVVAAAVAAAGIAIWRYWDRISAIFTGVGQAIGAALQPGLDWVGEKLSFLTPLVDGFGAAWGWVREKLSGLGELLSGLFTRETLSEEDIARITERAQEVTENIIGWFADMPARIGEAASALVEAGRGLIQSIWDGARERFGEFIDWVAGIPGRIIDAIGRIDLSSLVSFGEPPRWLRWMMGEEEVTPPEIPAPPRQAEFDSLPEDQRSAAETLAAARAAGDLPTPQYLQDLSDYAGHLHGEMAGVQAQIDQIDQNGPMGDSLAAPLLANLGRLQEELVGVEADLDAGRLRADEVTEALRILGETDTTPEIDTASIDRALTRVRALRAEMAAAEGSAVARVPSVPEIDGARAGGGPVSRDGTYLVGEEGPELVTPSRSGFVNTFGAIQDVVAAIQRLPSAVAAVQSIGPQLVTPTPAASEADAIEGPALRVGTTDAVDAPAAAQRVPRAAFPKIDVQISIAPTIHTTERVDPAQLSRDISEQMRSELREAFRGVFADTGMRFA
jgi:TP901 family phage tail tape measure protein